MKKVQGYIVIHPNEPDGRGLYYFTLGGAVKHKTNMDTYVEEKWDDGKTFNKEYWKEKPLPAEIYEVILGDPINGTN